MCFEAKFLLNLVNLKCSKIPFKQIQNTLESFQDLRLYHSFEGFIYPLELPHYINNMVYDSDTNL